MEYIAYYRVSTKQQGISGLGLEAQQSTVNSYCKGNIMASYTDIESGKNNKRPELLKAIDHTNRIGATLVVAKLDRLSRNSVFIGMLLESRVRFVCCDMPDANEFTIHIFAAMAQQERKMISERTTAALTALKAKGIKLGNPKHKDPTFKAANMLKARQSRKPKEHSRTVTSQIQQMKQNGLSFKAIADELNLQGLKTDRNKPYSATQIWRIYTN
jgi:DNA invertase Pin-like site-specific DNA recombinase